MDWDASYCSAVYACALQFFSPLHHGFQHCFFFLNRVFILSMVGRSCCLMSPVKLYTCIPGSVYDFSRGTIIVKGWRHFGVFPWTVLRRVLSAIPSEGFLLSELWHFFFPWVIHSFKFPLSSVCQGPLWYNSPAFGQFCLFYFTFSIWVWSLCPQSKLNNISKTLPGPVFHLVLWYVCDMPVLGVVIWAELLPTVV